MSAHASGLFAAVFCAQLLLLLCATALCAVWTGQESVVPMPRQPRYARHIGSHRVPLLEDELKQVAFSVASMHAGRHRKDRSRYEHAGANAKTQQKYLHVIRIWIDYCFVVGIFSQRWTRAELDDATWGDIAEFIYRYSSTGVVHTTLESYMSMMSHVLIMMSRCAPRQRDYLHDKQGDVIRRVVTAFCEKYPECRAQPNTKSAWDDVLVDASMQLLLVWGVYGHCCLKLPAWPAFARVVMAMLNYLGWRPMSLTCDRVDKIDLRWKDQTVLGFGDCRMIWQDGWLVAVQVFGKRTKFQRNPIWLRVGPNRLRARTVLGGKLTFCQQANVCACLAWLVWAIVNGAFGYAPMAKRGRHAFMVHDAKLKGPSDMTGADVDRLVASIFAIQPSGVPADSLNMPVLSGKLVGGAAQVCTDRVSKAVRVVGIRLGLNPRCLGAVCGRKTCVTKVVLHPESKDVDCVRTFGHANPRLTSIARYLDSSARNADSRSMLTGAPMRHIPGSVQLAHTRNMHPDMQLAPQVGLATRSAVPMSQPSYVKLNAYTKAHTAEMQRQFDLQESLPKAGDTTQLLLSFDFKALDCSRMSQQAFVAWQVKKAWGLL